MLYFVATVTGLLISAASPRSDAAPVAPLASARSLPLPGVAQAVPSAQLAQAIIITLSASL
ncbi:MAG: hypothetical protein R2856_38580 [Caldilineaceae bacterium]